MYKTKRKIGTNDGRAPDTNVTLFNEKKIKASKGLKFNEKQSKEDKGFEI